MNSNKLDILVRKNKGKTQFPFYVTELSHLLKFDVAPQIVSLEESDRLFEVHRRSSAKAAIDREFAMGRTWRLEPREMWQRVWNCVLKILQEKDAVLFVGPHEFCGGIRVKVAQVIADPIPLIEFDKDSIRLQAFDSDAGLYLDLFEEDFARNVELLVWGDWRRIASTCL